MSKTKSLAHKATEAQELAKKEISELQQKIEKINTLSGIVKKEMFSRVRKRSWKPFFLQCSRRRIFLVVRILK